MESTLLIFDFEWRPLLNYLKTQGIVPPQLPVQPGALEELPSYALYDWIVRNHTSVFDGLLLGAHYRVSDYGVAGLALMSADSFGDALKVVRTYMLLFNPDIGDIRVEQAGNDEVRIATSLRTRPAWNEAARQFHANVLASAAHQLFQGLLGGDVRGLGLTLPAGLQDTQAYCSYFKMPVRSAGSNIVFHLPANMLDRPVPSANPAVFQASLALASEHFNRLLEVELGGMRQRVMALLASLPERYPDIRQIANHLKLTERTLRRRLVDEGSSYRQIVDEARLQRTKELLGRTKMSTEQIAELVGYSDASGLRQAFRRWTGMTVSEFRQRGGNS